MNRFAIGHVLIKTKKLGQAVKDFEKLGFTVTYRTDRAKAHNALIFLQDGSFLELFNPKPVKLPDKLLLALLRLLRPLHPAMMRRLHHYLSSPEGISDYALDSLQPEQAKANVDAMLQDGAPIGKTINMSKTLPDGRKQTWWMALPLDPLMPFFMSAYDPDMPCTKEESTHDNGAISINKLVIEVPELEQWVLRYKAFTKGADIFRTELKYEIILGKKHTILLRKAQNYRIAEIHLITAHPIKEAYTFQAILSHGAAIIMNPPSGSSLE
jgi:hypothetical protein